jgi:N-dimethylarginine dimethylaminohydrolase
VPILIERIKVEIKKHTNMKYRITPKQLQNGKWIGEYADLKKEKFWGGACLTPDRVSVVGSFQTREEAIENVKKYLKKIGVEEEDIEVREWSI